MISSPDTTNLFRVGTDTIRRLGAIAHLATESAAGPFVQHLATESPTSGRAAGLVGRLTSLAITGYKSGSRPLELTVTPATEQR